jgi:hypothetical protein
MPFKTSWQENKKYVKHLKSDDCQFLTLQACNQYWIELATEHYREVYDILDLILLSFEYFYSYYRKGIFINFNIEPMQKRELWNLMGRWPWPSNQEKTPWSQIQIMSKSHNINQYVWLSVFIDYSLSNLCLAWCRRWRNRKWKW